MAPIRLAAQLSATLLIVDDAAAPHDPIYNRHSNAVTGVAGFCRCPGCRRLSTGKAAVAPLSDRSIASSSATLRPWAWQQKGCSPPAASIDLA